MHNASYFQISICLGKSCLNPITKIGIFFVIIPQFGADFLYIIIKRSCYGVYSVSCHHRSVVGFSFAKRTAMFTKSIISGAVSISFYGYICIEIYIPAHGRIVLIHLQNVSRLIVYICSRAECV